jgi:hypothetical protein
MNFVLEELRQVDWLVIKIKQVPFLLYSLALCFFDGMAVVCVFFSALSLVNIKTRFCFFTDLYFSHQTLIHRTQLMLFLQQIVFPLPAFAEGIDTFSRLLNFFVRPK